MDNQAYEQRVRAVCDEMRQKLIETGDAQRLPDDAFLPILARIAVAEMAEIAKYILQVVTGWSDYDIEKELKGRGLIPDNGK